MANLHFLQVLDEIDPQASNPHVSLWMDTFTHVRRTKMMFYELVHGQWGETNIFPHSEDMCHQIKHVQFFFRKFHFLSPGAPRKSWGTYFYVK